MRWLFGPEVEYWIFKVLMPEVGRIHGAMLTYIHVAGPDSLEKINEVNGLAK